MIKFVDLLEEYGGGEFELPENHKAGLRVPKGGSCCANCKWWVHKGDSEEYHCASTYYQKWAGTDTIPYAADEYCTNWWEPRENLDKEKAEK